MEFIKLTPSLVNKIKKIIDLYSKDEKTIIGLSELIGWYAKGFITVGQCNKIQSFYNTFDSSNPDEVQRKKIYEELHILPFVQNNLRQIKNVDKVKNKVKNIGNVLQTRTVDRLTKPSLASVRPPLDPTALPQLTENINRIKDLINKTSRL
jgi:hypothetical protein